MGSAAVLGCTGRRLADRNQADAPHRVFGETPSTAGETPALPMPLFGFIGHEHYGKEQAIFHERLKPPRGFGLHQSSGALGIAGRYKSGRELPQSKTLPRTTSLRSLYARQLDRRLPMRAVIQRVSEASVAIDGQIKSAIRTGLLVLLAVEESDTSEDIDWMSGKLVRLRIFRDDQGQMNRSVQEVQGDILIVSQFTLFASTRKGNRPSYSRAARPETAIPLYEAFVRKVTEELGHPVRTGEFGADMKVTLVNDGPVTILIDSKSKE